MTISWFDPPLNKWQNSDGTLFAAFHPTFQKLALYRANDIKFLFSCSLPDIEIFNCTFSVCNHFLLIETDKKAVFILDLDNRDVVQVLEGGNYCRLFWISWQNKNSLLGVISLVKNRIYLYHKAYLVMEISIHGIKDVKSLVFESERIIVDGEREFYLNKVPKIDKILEKYSLFFSNINSSKIEKYIEEIQLVLNDPNKQRYKTLMDDFLTLLTPLFIFEELGGPTKQLIDQLYEIYDQLENNSGKNVKFFNPSSLLHAISFFKSDPNFSIFLTTTTK
jgi:hypothetical protein